MKLTRKQELQLIEIGLDIHLNKTLFPLKLKKKFHEKKAKSPYKWSKKQRAEFMKTWNAKHNGKKV